MTVIMIVIVIAMCGLEQDRTGRLVEDQLARLVLIVVVEVEHVIERPRDGVE